MVRGSRSVHDGWVRNLKGDFTLVAYEFYIPDSDKGPQLIGILPERRRDPRRISEESIMKWGERVIGGPHEHKKSFLCPCDDRITMSQTWIYTFNILPPRRLCRNEGNAVFVIVNSSASLRFSTPLDSICSSLRI